MTSVGQCRLAKIVCVKVFRRYEFVEWLKGRDANSPPTHVCHMGGIPMSWVIAIRTLRIVRSRKIVTLSVHVRVPFAFVYGRVMFESIVG